MTQGIRDFLNLPPIEDVMREQGVELPEDDIDDMENSVDPAFLSRLEAATLSAKDAANRLAAVDGRDHDETMDEICKQTLKHAQDLVDLGFNVEQTKAAKFFEVAAKMYEKATNAKKIKRDAQLVAMRLALEQRKLDLDEVKMRHDMGEQPAVDAATPNAGGVVIEDRNAIIKRFIEEKKAGKLPE